VSYQVVFFPYASAQLTHDAYGDRFTPKKTRTWPFLLEIFYFSITRFGSLLHLRTSGLKARQGIPFVWANSVIIPIASPASLDSVQNCCTNVIRPAKPGHLDIRFRRIHNPPFELKWIPSSETFGLLIFRIAAACDCSSISLFLWEILINFNH
jgi:hypothetical protein